MTTMKLRTLAAAIAISLAPLVSHAQTTATAGDIDKQTQLLDTFEQFNLQQLARGKQEMEFASEFAGKITSARSVPDVMNAYQNWISKLMALYMEDGQRVLNTTKKLLSIGKESNNT